MKSIEDAARDYQRSDESDGTTATAFEHGAEWMREELTQWHDPNKPPAKGHTVLLKIKNSEDNVKYAVGYNACGCWYGGGVGRYDHVVGWREIHE